MSSHDDDDDGVWLVATQEQWDALVAENQRLRDTLERITALRTTEGDDLEDAVAVARAALSGTPSEDTE
jgi:hypothetical protein